MYFEHDTCPACSILDEMLLRRIYFCQTVCGLSVSFPHLYHFLSPEGSKVLQNDEFTKDLFRFLQLLCEGHNGGEVLLISLMLVAE